jgi:hypothetical protein
MATAYVAANATAWARIAIDTNGGLQRCVDF